MESLIQNFDTFLPLLFVISSVLPSSNINGNIYFFFIYWKENCGIFSKFVSFVVGNPNLLKIIWNFKKSHVLQFFIRCLFKVVSHILMNKKTLISVLCDNPNNLCVFFVFAAHFIIFDCSLECVRYLFYAFVLKIKQNFLNKFVCLQVVTH